MVMSTQTLEKPSLNRELTPSPVLSSARLAYSHDAITNIWQESRKTKLGEHTGIKRSVRDLAKLAVLRFFDGKTETDRHDEYIKSYREHFKI